MGLGGTIRLVRRPGSLHLDPVATTERIFAFESQWDAFAVIDKLGWHNGTPSKTAAAITRGASNGKLIAGVCAPNALILAFPQNDEPNAKTGERPGDKWLAAIASDSGCQCVSVRTPEPHKDTNDWTRAGASADDLLTAIDEARSFECRTTTVDFDNPNIATEESEFEEVSGEDFPLNALPIVAAEMVRAVSRSERVPIALPAVCALGLASAALGKGLEVASGGDRTTRGNLFLLASAESGSGKSETFRLIAAPFLDHQQRQIENWQRNKNPQIQAEIRVLDKQIESLERKAAKATNPADHDQLVKDLKDKIARKDELARRSSMPCIIAQDVTIERLAVLTRDSREVMFSASADARKLVDNLLGRYNPGKTTDESFYLSAFSGDHTRVDRQGRETVVLNSPCLSLCWFIQPDLMTTMLGEETLSASGVLPRPLLCHTNATPQKIQADDCSLPDAARIGSNQLIQYLLERFHSAEEPCRIYPAPEAHRTLTDFYSAIVDRRASDLVDVGCYAARYAEQAWRLAVVLHAIRFGSEAGNTQLSEETSRDAIRIVEWFICAQLDVLAKGRRAAEEMVESEVLNLLTTRRQRKQSDLLTARDVYRARIVNKPEAASALLARMERDHLLVGEDVRPPHGGRCTRIYRASTVANLEF